MLDGSRMISLRTTAISAISTTARTCTTLSCRSASTNSECLNSSAMCRSGRPHRGCQPVGLAVVRETGVMWANMLVLFCLSLIPVVTEWLRDFYRQPIPAASFGIVGLAAALSYSALVRSIIRANGRESAVAIAIASDVKGYVSLVMYAAGVGLAFVAVWIAYVLYAAVAVMWLIPDRRFTRRPARGS